ncbi:DUF1638 domain-containing protein [Desulfocicer niacini]
MKSWKKALQHYGNGPKAVIYGTCHPCMDVFIEQGNAQRTRGQNCVEHLLGKEQFDYHLEKGAFFIMDDRASRWDFITGLAFGGTSEIIREIFSIEHTHLLGLEPPCTESLLALERFQNAPDDFDLVITDMTMPNKAGDKLFMALRRIRPGITILICTGFSEYLSS